MTDQADDKTPADPPKVKSGRPTRSKVAARTNLFKNRQDGANTASKKTVSLREEVEWVYLNIHVRKVEKKVGEDGGPPSSGALAMLKWARMDTNSFMTLLKNVMGEKGAGDKRAGEVGNRVRFQVAEIEKMIEELIE